MPSNQQPPTDTAAEPASLDALLGDYYAQQTMPSALAASIVDSTDLHHRKERVWLRRMVAAIAVLAIGFGVLHVQLRHQTEADLVLREIALNHRQDHGADVYASNYSELVAALDRLPLPAALPASLGGQYQVVGGRYCSVGGRLAAKLMLRHAASGDNVSLFATEQTPALERIGEHDVVADGVDVRLWSANSMFFALAHNVGS